MTEFGVSDVILLARSTLSVTLTLVVFMYLFVQRRSTRYDEVNHCVQLEMLRRSIEAQMYGLSEKLVATESRWRDINHVLIDSQARQPNSPPSRTTLTPVLESAGLTQADLQVDPELVFVLTAFHAEFQPVFDAISLICRDLGLKAFARR
jgi:hypothetical protein